MVSFNHIKVIQSLKRAFPKHSSEYQKAQEFEALLIEEEAAKELYENKLFKSVHAQLKDDILVRLEQLVKSDPELQAMANQYKRFYRPKDATRLVREHLEQYLDEDQLQELGS
jgi:hypothetical protein